MKNIFDVWNDTKGVVLIAVSAAIYSASLIPFKVFPIIPGSTEIRPGAVFPVVLGLLFGPAGAWGSAIGNTVADIFGMFGAGTIPGFFGNFFFAYVPFILWNRVWFLSRDESPDFKKIEDYLQFILLSITASVACSTIIGWGLDTMGLLPFATISPIIFLNNILATVIIGPFLMAGIFQRVKKWGLVYDDFAGRKSSITLRQRIGVLLIFVGLYGALLSGFTIVKAFSILSHFSISIMVFLFLSIFIIGISII